MNASPLLRTLRCLPLLVCLFIWLDAYEIPAKGQRELVIGLTDRSFGRKGDSFRMITGRSSFAIGEELYRATNGDDSVTVFRSRLTGLAQKVTLQTPERNFTDNTGLAHVLAGQIFLSLFTAAGMGFLLWSPRITDGASRFRINLVLLLLSLGLLYAYFGL